MFEWFSIYIIYTYVLMTLFMIISVIGSMMSKTEKEMQKALPFLFGAILCAPLSFPAYMGALVGRMLSEVDENL